MESLRRVHATLIVAITPVSVNKLGGELTFNLWLVSVYSGISLYAHLTAEELFLL